jgi:hypothetical protein
MNALTKNTRLPNLEDRSPQALHAGDGQCVPEASTVARFVLS